MKRFEIFYFSGTGNTWWVSERIAEGLRDHGFDGSAHSIEQVSASEAEAFISAADALGFGFPIYGSDVPRYFLRFLQALPRQTEKKAALGFVTQMAWSGDGFNFLGKMLGEKGYDLKWAMEFNMPNNVTIPLVPLPYSADYSHFEKKLAQAAQKAEGLCRLMAAGEAYREHTDLVNRASAWLQRGPWRLMHDYAGRIWSVDKAACTSCKRCANICPVENIQMEAKFPVFGNACIMCLRCFNYCPTLAIHYAGMSNRRGEKNRPYKGPVKDFTPELICKQEK